METATLPRWRVRLMTAHEHEIIPTAKPGGKPLSNQAAAAKMIRQTLKRVFPGVAFRVTSDSFAGGDSVDVHWTDGPTADMVNAAITRHQYGHFDGSIDLYEYSNTRADIPQAKYVHAHRETSRAAYLAAVAHINRRFGWAMVPHEEWNTITTESDKRTGHGWQSQEIHRFLWPLALLCPACDAATLPGDCFCGECGGALVEADA